MPRTAILFTVLNDGPILKGIIPHVRASCNGMHYDIWVVNDGSTDATSEIAKEAGCRLITHKQNLGVGAAYKTGFEAILDAGGYDYVVHIDSDGQHLPEFIPGIFHMLEAGADMAVCSRFHPDSRQIGIMLDRCILNLSVAQLISKFTRWCITDARSGYFGIRTSRLVDITPRLVTARYGIPIELTLRLWQIYHSARRWEIPHPALYRGHGNDTLLARYAREDIRRKAKRIEDAYRVILSILPNLNLTLEEILRHFEWRVAAV